MVKLLAHQCDLRFISCARAHGMRTYEPRQGRKAATVVCSASAVVTLAFFSLRIATCYRPSFPVPIGEPSGKSQIVNGMSYQVIARKYRPQRFSDVVGQ